MSSPAFNEAFPSPDLHVVNLDGSVEVPGQTPQPELIQSDSPSVAPRPIGYSSTEFVKSTLQHRLDRSSRTLITLTSLAPEE